MISIGKINLLIKTGLAIVTVGTVTPVALNANPPDSTKASLLINSRLHSAGYFPYTGALLNHNPVADVNVFFEKKMFGFYVFQSLDLADRHSYANYLQPGVFATFRFHPSFRLRTFFGYIFSQTRGFRDPDSDFYAAATLTKDLSKHFRIENTALFYDYNIQKKLANRLSVSWSSQKFRADFYLWHRTVLDENKQAISASLALTFPILKLNKNTALQFTGAYLRYITAYRPSFALRDGFLFTIAVPVNVLP